MAARAAVAVPTWTVADNLVLSKFPMAKLQHLDGEVDCAMAVKGRKAEAAAYDEPIFRNTAAKNEEFAVLPEMIRVDEYGYAVRPDEAELKARGGYEEMRGCRLPTSRGSAGGRGCSSSRSTSPRS